MSILLLLLGLAVWTAAHWFKRVAPERRARMWDAGKGLVTILILLSLAAMIYGYRWAPFIEVWTPPTFFVHINNLLMLLAFYVYMSTAALPGKVWIASKIRHPQLIGTKIWAIAHLLVNGDLASVLLFGGLLGWAVGSVILINRGGDTFDRSRAPIKNEFVFALVSLAVFAVVVGLHVWAGVWPFPS